MFASPRGIVSSIAATAAVVALTMAPSAQAGSPLSYEIVNEDSKVSAMMMGVINEDYVYILDKVEQNKARSPSGNKPAWGSIYNLADNSVYEVDVNTNTFCASGITLGNGSWIVAGGNQPITYAGEAIADGTGPYADYDGRKALRMLQPVASGSGNASIQWLDNPGGLQMQSQRWYPGIETLPDGSLVLIGGANNGGFINRNYPNDDPAFAGGGSMTNPSGGGANPTYEFYPPRASLPAGNGTLGYSNFMVKTSGLNMYPHMFLLPSGNIFMQANYSTVIWNYTANTETYLQEMPGQIIRVYPASGATAMLPLTPANKYVPTILFCGGFYADDSLWGDYAAPRFNPLTSSASDDCSSITPSNEDGSDNPSAQYVREEKLPEGRTMGQFIILPTGQMVILNGAEKGVAGYGNVTKGSLSYEAQKVAYTWSNVFNDSNGNTIYTESMTQNPTYTPVLYDPEKPLGSRLTRTGFGSSKVARLYHSSAVLVADGSILVGGSNPHMDVALNLPKTIAGITTYPTTYELEKWYPDYYFEDRPQPSGLPSSIMYGGNTWSFTMDAKYMGSSANAKAAATKIMVVRPGFSTHAMNMGQRAIQLEHSYTVNDDGSVKYTVMPMPSNVNIYQPGPAFLFVTINGIPSKGKYIIVGSTAFSGTIPNNFAAAAGNTPTLPKSVQNSKYNASLSQNGAESFGIGKIVGIAVGGAALLGLILLGILCWRRQANKKAAKAGGYGAPGAGPAAGGAIYGQSSYRDGPGGEYKRVNTPTSSVHAFAAPATRGSLATYDSYKMNDVSGPNTPYFDTPRGADSRSPLGHNDYASQGWGEHQGGDAGAYYHDNMDRSEGGAARYYDNGSYGSAHGR